MSLLGVALSWLLEIYFYVLLGRFVLELLRSINPSFRPRGLFLVLAEVVMTITDPPLKLVRRVVKPVRIGAASLDFSWTIVLLLVTLLNSTIRDMLL